MTVTLYEGDNRDSLRRLIEQGVRVHSVVTDPPYGLVSITRRFGKDGSKPARKSGNDGSFTRLSGGFMGKKWDSTGIERDPEFWSLVYDILLPGGFVFAFSGSRTGHWQACAMEMAGFIMHPMHGWCFGSGLPKGHAADKAIDKLLGKRGTYGGVKPGYEGHYGTDNVRSMRESGTMAQAGGFSRPWMNDPDAILRQQQQQYIPATPEAAQWSGYAYGTQTQKPALEPIYLGQKPFSEKSGAANLLKHGVGAFNIDGCRVPTSDNLNCGAYAKNATDRQQMWGADAGNSWKRGGAGQFVQPDGRHPSNLILDGSPEVLALFPYTKSGKPGVMRKAKNDGACYGAESRAPGTQMTGHGDEGSAARFFHQFPRYVCETCQDTGALGYEYVDNIAVADSSCPDCEGLSAFRPDTDPIIYHRKAGRDDRAGGKHPTVKPINLLRNLIRHITPPGGTVLDPFAGSGTTAEACKREGMNCVLMEAEPEYVDFLRRRFKLPVPVDPMFADLLGNDLSANSTESRISKFEDLLG